MEKLIELLNESMVESGFSPEWVISGNGVRAKKSYYGEEISEMLIISKKYSFIERLVDKDKIDRDNQALQYAKSDLSKFFAEWKDKDGMSDDYAMLLMLLAIQDKPINFLISILK